MSIEVPANNTPWIHKIKGTPYTVIGVSNIYAATRTVQVFYKNANETLWSIPLSEWHDKFIAKD